MVADRVRTKTGDYRIDDYGVLLETAIACLPELVRSGSFAREMERFLTDKAAERTIRTEGWSETVARELREQLAGLRRNLTQRGSGAALTATKPSRLLRLVPLFFAR